MLHLLVDSALRKNASVQTKKVCLNLRITEFFTNFDWFYAV